MKTIMIMVMMLVVTVLAKGKVRHLSRHHLRGMPSKTERGGDSYEPTSNTRNTYGLSSNLSDNNYAGLNKHIDEAEHKTENELTNLERQVGATGLSNNEDRVLDDIQNEQALGINDVLRDQYEKGII